MAAWGSSFGRGGSRVDGAGPASGGKAVAAGEWGRWFVEWRIDRVREKEAADVIA
jgi:hypothetical protein